MSVNNIDEDLSADAFDETDFPIPEEISISSPIEFPGDITPSLLASPEPPERCEEESPQPNEACSHDKEEQENDLHQDVTSPNAESSHDLEATSPLERESDELNDSVDSDGPTREVGDNDEEAEDEEEIEVPVTEVDNDVEDDGFEDLLQEQPRDTVEDGDGNEEDEEFSGLEGDKESEEQKDIACWLCHRELTDFSCSLCPRSYHLSCMENGTAGGGQDWICPVCEKVSDAECVDSPTNLPEYITQETLCLMLKLAISHCRPKVNDLFHFPVSLEHFPTYPSFVINPMDLATLEQNCKDMKYFSTNAFVADVEWIYHNSCVFNSSQSPISKLAKRAVNHLRNEVEIIEVCPSCYAHHLMGTGGFSQLCQEAHEPVWAKVSGYPYWPAKVIREKAMQVEVQFFGDHDRAWVPKNKVLRMSKSLPETVKHNHKAFEISMEELKDYCENLQLVTNFKFSSHRTSFTGENKISRIEVKRTRRLSNFEYDFDETKTSVKSEPDSSESATESDAGLPEEAEKEISIKEEPSDGLNNLDDTFQNLNTMTVPTSSSSSTSELQQTSPGDDNTPSNSNSSAVSTPQLETDPDDVDNFDMRFHFLSTLNSSTFLRSWSDTLDKDWVSENEEPNRDETRCDVDKVVSAVQSRFAGKSGDSLAKLSRDLGSTSASTCTSRSASSWLAARQKSFPSMVPFSNPMATRTIPKLQCTQPKQPSPLLMQPATSDAFSFTDTPMHKIPSATRLNMQVRQNIDPLSPMNASMGPPPTMVNTVPTWPGPIQHLPFEQNPALNPPNMFNPLDRMLPSSTFGPTPPTIIQQSPTPEMFMPTIVPLQNIQSLSAANQMRKRAADDRFSNISGDTLSQPPAAMRPRLEVKGTPNMEAQTQGSLTEAKIVDKVTEKLSDSLQTMVESFLSSRGINNNNNVNSSAEPSAKALDIEEAASLSISQLESKISSLQDELSQVRRAKEEEVAELRGCYEYLLAEVRHSAEIAFKTELDKFKTKTTNEIKSRQWCAVCKKEAFYNCCWNTSYCSCECQKRHWAAHANTCSHVPQQQQQQPTQASVSNSTCNGGESSSSAVMATPHNRQFLSQVSTIPSVTGPYPNLENAAKAVCSDSLHYQQPTVRFLNQHPGHPHHPMPISSAAGVGGSGLHSNSSHIVKAAQRPKLLSSGSYMNGTPKIQSVMSLAAHQNS